MEVLGPEPELVLQLYDAVLIWVAWLLGGSTFLVALLYLLCLWVECFSSARRKTESRPARPVSTDAGAVTLKPQWIREPLT
jgi:hypothetical protein